MFWLRRPATSAARGLYARGIVLALLWAGAGVAEAQGIADGEVHGWCACSLTRLELRDVETGVARETVSRRDGSYLFLGVAPGEYRLNLPGAAGVGVFVVPGAAVELPDGGVTRQAEEASAVAPESFGSFATDAG